MENGAIVQFISIILVFVVFYLIIFIPENRRKKKFKAMIEALKLNDQVMTRGGVIGTIVNIKDDYVIIQTGPDKMRIKFNKNSISTILNNQTK